MVYPEDAPDGAAASARSEAGGPPASDEAQPRRSGRAGWASEAIHLALALVVAGVFLLASVGRSGVWDPHELDRSDLARRIAVNVFGSDGLRFEGAANGLPTLSDLGSGELAYTSMALGFELFGLHDWAGRLPLALWGIVGALVLYLLLDRLVSARAGLYAVIALVTMPLFFMQARTMLGDVVTMTACLCCFAGWTLALLGTARTGSRPAWGRSALWWLLGLSGAVAGYLSRGLLIGVAAPALAVGLSWLCLTLSPSWRPDGRARWRFHAVGALVLALGLAALYLGVATLLDHAGTKGQVLRHLGVELLAKPPRESTFDLTVRDLGHALLPWSAFIPFALGRLLTLPPGLDRSGRQRELGLRVALLVGAACLYGAHALLAPYAGGLPFSGPGLLAAIAALAIVDFERGSPPSALVGGGTLVLGAVLLGDVVRLPVKVLAVFGVGEQSFPSSFGAKGARLLLIAYAAFGLVVLLSWMERSFEQGPGGLRGWLRQRLGAYRNTWRALSTAYHGNLAFGALVLEAALVGLGAMLLIGKHLGWSSVAKLPHNYAVIGLNAWWVLPLAPLAAVIALDAARGLYAAALGPSRSRAAGLMVAALVSGGILCFGYYPALAAQLSPKEVFESYADQHRPGEPLGIVGLKARTARFYARGEAVKSLANVRAAHRWLMTAHEQAEEPPRRWLVLRTKDLPELNSLFRKSTGRNLPVLDDRSGTIVLASNRLGSEPNRNWLEPLVRAEPPDVQHPVSAQFEDKLEALGWELADLEGRPVEFAVPQRAYRLRLFYRVLKPIGRNYKAFIHIDGYRRRHNGDHEVLRGEYRMSLWRPGDVIIDEYEMKLEPNFMPGRYTLFYGFFQGKSRFEVTRGKHHDNRLNGGTIVVR